MDSEVFHATLDKLTQQLQETMETAEAIRASVGEVLMHAQVPAPESFPIAMTIFVLAVFVGYYVVWKVTPALHSPLMAVTNAISSVIILGALVAAGASHVPAAGALGFLGAVLAAINIFGGFVVTQRMLQMFMKKK